MSIVPVCSGSPAAMKVFGRPLLTVLAARGEQSRVGDDAAWWPRPVVPSVNSLF
jgi:hypothetical protein